MACVDDQSKLSRVSFEIVTLTVPSPYVPSLGLRSAGRKSAQPLFSSEHVGLPETVAGGTDEACAAGTAATSASAATRAAKRPGMRELVMGSPSLGQIATSPRNDRGRCL